MSTDKHSVFSTCPPIEMLIHLCDTYFTKVDDMFYLIEPHNFKMMCIVQGQKQFLHTLRIIYKPSAVKKYMHNGFTYSFFLTMAKQICDANHREYKKRVFYEHGKPQYMFYVSLQ